MLLRKDIHRLFDDGYVTVMPDRRFRVSKAIKDEFENGRDYYALDGRPVSRPCRSTHDQPKNTWNGTRRCDSRVNGAARPVNLSANRRIIWCLIGRSSSRVRAQGPKSSARQRPIAEALMCSEGGMAESRAWKEAVRGIVQTLPREFSLADVLAYNDEPQRRFPNNRFIDAKIRQILQVLRDQGLLRFVRPGHYEREMFRPTLARSSTFL